MCSPLPDRHFTVHKNEFPMIQMYTFKISKQKRVAEENIGFLL
jgi:hypothetical protein